MDSTELPEDVAKFAAALYTRVYIDRCADRGYTHIEDEDMLKKALLVTDRLREDNAASLAKRNELAKKATDKALAGD